MQAREIHALACEIHAQARADHPAVRGGWNKVVKTSTGSWEDGKDLGEARRRCVGTKIYKSSLEKTRAENHCRIENGAIAGGGTRPEGAN